jgi:hypothetical protein
VPVTAQDGNMHNQPFYVVKMEQTLAVMDKCMWQSAGATKPIPFDNLKLGPILGKGSFGRVYPGIYNGVPVAVKVPHYTVLSSCPPSSNMRVEDIPQFCGLPKGISLETGPHGGASSVHWETQFR